MTATRRPSDSGFTLPELLVAITIMVLVMGTLGFSLVSVLRTLGGAEDRVDRANTNGLVSYTFAMDVGAARSVLSGAGARCGSGTLITKMTTSNVRRTAASTTPAPASVWYCVSSDAQLMRYECPTDSACNAGNYTTSTSLANAVVTAGTQRPTIRCERVDTTQASGFSVVDCNADALLVRRVMLSFTLPPGTTRDRAADAAQSIAVYGVRSR